VEWWGLVDEFVALPSIMALEDDVAVAEPEGLGQRVEGGLL